MSIWRARTLFSRSCKAGRSNEAPDRPPSSNRSRTSTQPDLGSARPRSGCRDGAIRWILGSGYYRNARKQSERGVPPGDRVGALTTRQRTAAFADAVEKLEFWHRTQFSPSWTALGKQNASGSLAKLAFQREAVAVDWQWQRNAHPHRARVGAVNEEISAKFAASHQFPSQ
jgi:hypothetical protein